MPKIYAKQFAISSILDIVQAWATEAVTENLKTIQTNWTHARLKTELHLTHDLKYI